MALIRTGHSISLCVAVSETLELTEQLINLGVSSELLESTVLNTPRRINGLLPEVTIPDSLIDDVYALFWYNPFKAAWEKISDYTQINNKIRLSKAYSGIVLVMPFDAFRDTYYADGEYDYAMTLSRLDNKVYRNIGISCASYCSSRHVSFLFSFSPDGPWSAAIDSPFLFDTFYMRVVVSGMSDVSMPQIVPSEMITLTCLTCE